MEKRLYRSSKDKMLGGVAAGLAEYFDIDPTIIRVLFVVTLFMGGSGIIAYIILWIVVPEAPFIPSNQSETKEPIDRNFNPANDPDYFSRLQKRKEKRLFFAGITLIIIGMIFLADNFIPRISFSDFFPLILIGIGIAFLLNIKKNKTI